VQTVRAGRKPNAKLLTREYLTEAEVERLIKAASSNRHGRRDATLILVIFRHGLRVSEACALRWADVDFDGNVHMRRVMNGDPNVHPLSGRGLRALRRKAGFALRVHQRVPQPVYAGRYRQGCGASRRRGEV
jgi:type 1 fimbriae regulatory protein FimB/type 1 fimbriae regulatory protein FimE